MGPLAVVGVRMSPAPVVGRALSDCGHIVDTQIAPLLREYWFDSPEIFQEAMDVLTADA